MKHMYPMLVAGIMVLCAGLHHTVSAQQQTRPFGLGESANFVKQFAPVSPAGKQVVQIPVSESLSFDITVNVNKQQGNTYSIIGSVNGHPHSTFFIDGENGRIEGKMVLLDEKKAYTFYTDETGKAFAEPIDINKVVCVEYAELEEEEDRNEPVQAMAQPQNLESLPGANHVIYLDFDGEYVVSRWDGGNPIDADPSGFSDTKITSIWNAIREDYHPFNVNVTTNRAVFDATPVGQRMMVIFTPTNTASPGAGGVAYLWSFSSNDDDPCWVFNSGTKGAYEAGSHEAGHTLGLSHDGTSSQNYFAGHGNWGPIMGATYNRDIVQWSKGEYNDANNQEDDLAMISGSTNGFGYRPDDHGNDIGNATPFIDDGSGNLSTNDNNGIIERTNDKDVFSFYTTGGTLSLNFIPFPSYPDLDIQARLLDDAGNELFVANPTTLNTSMIRSLTAGTYFIEVDGVGEGDPAGNGYSDYASLGYYSISGSYPTGPNTQPPDARFSSSGGGCEGVVQFTDESINTVDTWIWDFGDGNTSSQQSPMHTYATSGTYDVKLLITGPYGTDSVIKNSEVTVLIPEVTSVTHDASCDPAVLNLGAAGTGDLTWYDAPTGGNMVTTGTSYTTPLLNTTTSYWIESTVYEIQTNVQPPDNSLGGGSYFTNNDLRGLFFDVLAPFTLKTAKVYAGSSGNRQIDVLDGEGGSVVHTKTINIPAGESRITLDFAMQPGNGYFIKVTGNTIDLFRNNSGPSYPYTVPGYVSITGTNASVSGYYYFFYDWEIEKSCTQGRTEVTGTIYGSPATPVVSFDGSTLSTASGPYTYQWYRNGNLVWNQTNDTYTPQYGGSYVVEITDANGCTVASDPFLVTSTDDPAGEVSLLVYPNPGKGLFNVRLQGAGNTTLEVYNTIGEKVIERGVQASYAGQSLQLDLTGHAAGIYVLKAVTEYGVLTERLLIK